MRAGNTVYHRTTSETFYSVRRGIVFGRISGLPVSRWLTWSKLKTAVTTSAGSRACVRHGRSTTPVTP